MTSRECTSRPAPVWLGPPLIATQQSVVSSPALLAAGCWLLPPPLTDCHHSPLARCCCCLLHRPFEHRAWAARTSPLRCSWSSGSWRARLTRCCRRDLACHQSVALHWDLSQQLSGGSDTACSTAWFGVQSWLLTIIVVSYSYSTRNPCLAHCGG